LLLGHAVFLWGGIRRELQPGCRAAARSAMARSRALAAEIACAKSCADPAAKSAGAKTAGKTFFINPLRISADVFRGSTA